MLGNRTCTISVHTPKLIWSFENKPLEQTGNTLINCAETKAVFIYSDRDVWAPFQYVHPNFQFCVLTLSSDICIQYLVSYLQNMSLVD